MAVLRIDLEGNPRTIQYRSFINIANDSLAILDDLDRAFSRRRNYGALEWYMQDVSKNGGLSLEIYSKVRAMKRKTLEDVGMEVARSFVTGFHSLEEEGKSPAFLTDRGMYKAKALTQEIGGEGKPNAILASNPEQNSSIEITRRSAANLDLLLPTAYKSIGSVEGTLEAISVRKPARFVVYESLTDKGVSCVFSALDVLLPKLKDALGKRVLVTGKLHRNKKGEAIRVLVERPEDLRVFESDLTILPFKDLGGSDPDFTGSLTTEEFIRRIRG